MIEIIKKELERNEKILNGKDPWDYEISHYVGRVSALKDILKILITTHSSK